MQRCFSAVPSTREEIRFHMKERDPPGCHFGRAVGGAIPSVFGSFRTYCLTGPCYHQVGPVSRTALISAQEQNVLGSTEVYRSGSSLVPLHPRYFSFFFFNATSAWTGRHVGLTGLASAAPFSPATHPPSFLRAPSESIMCWLCTATLAEGKRLPTPFQSMARGLYNPAISNG